jgi:hypothetical protein
MVMLIVQELLDGYIDNIEGIMIRQQEIIDERNS